MSIRKRFLCKTGKRRLFVGILSLILLMLFPLQTSAAVTTTAQTSSAISVPKKASINIGQKKRLSSFVITSGNKKVNVKNIKTSNKKILTVSGQYVIGKKAGKAKITAVFNGKKKTIIFTVHKKNSEPTLDQLKIKVTGYTYNPYTRKTYIQTRFSNTSRKTITKVKLKYRMTLNEEIAVTKTYAISIKPGTNMSKMIYVGKLITDPSDIKVKCLTFWYKA
ncbi:hypothetical protein [Blautia luti]|uniref:hypothetical protein n=1 Tax=Blautia luti TaxID=89014 RepID=UPI0018A942C5|nr:hypothetical protein [Blautia luti]